MSSRYATPLCLDIQYPRFWLWCLLLIHAAVLLALAMLQWPPAARILTGVLWFVSLRWSLAPLLQVRHPGRVQRAVWGAGDEWRLWFADGGESGARLDPDFFQQLGVTQLLLRDASRGRMILLLLPGMLPEEVYRRLRVRLRLFAHAQADRSRPAAAAGRRKI